MQTKATPKRTAAKKLPPAEAKSAVLDAAEMLISERGPDAVSLADVAKAASVTQAFISDSFGTYQDLVSAVVARHRDLYALRATELVARTDFVPGTGEALEILIDLLSDRRHARLVAWSLLRGAHDVPFFDHERMRTIIDVAAAAGAARLGLPADVLRKEAEGRIAMVSYAAFGFAIAGDSVSAALGREPSAEDAGTFRRQLRVMIQGYLALAGPRALPLS